MKKAIVTIANGEHFQRMAALTHPTIKAYANRIGADFFVWSDATGYQILEYKKLEIRGLLDTYDRVLYIDTDVIVRDDAPDVFDVVPADHLGMFEEGIYYDRRMSTLDFMEEVGFDSSKWNGRYFNAGIFVCSKCHRDMFVRPPIEWDCFRDQTYFNILIADRGVKVFPLPHRFNRMVGMDAMFGECRLDSYFLHYAGIWATLSPQAILDLIASDLRIWQQCRPHYQFPESVAIIVDGGLGRQVAAEPAARYARHVLYRQAEMAIVTHYPQVFRRLNVPTFDAIDQVPNSGAYYRLYTGGDPKTPPGEGPSRHQVHATQLAALLALGLELPSAYGRPALPVDTAAVRAVTERIRPHELRKLVLLHPGRGAAPATFPAEVWQAYADTLVAGGFQVAVIGKRLDERRGIVDFDRSKYLDLVDATSVEELIALVSQARVLISNDTAPVQIAGAFDNWIGLIATLRHPEYVLPWRRGSQFWRAANLERHPLYYDYVHKPSGSRQPSLDACHPDRLRACLPEPEQVLQFVQSAFAERPGKPAA